MVIIFSLEEAKHNTLERESKAVQIDISITFYLHVSKIIIKKELSD